jgi:hypothetical protein
MVILAYLVSVIVFFIIDLITTSLSLTIYTLVVGLIEKRIRGYTDAAFHSINQFLGAFLGVLTGSYVGNSIATLVTEDLNMNVQFGLFCFVYYTSNFYTSGASKPWAQKSGAILGLAISFALIKTQIMH